VAVKYTTIIVKSDSDTVSSDLPPTVSHSTCSVKTVQKSNTLIMQHAYVNDNKSLD